MITDINTITDNVIIQANAETAQDITIGIAIENDNELCLYVSKGIFEAVSHITFYPDKSNDDDLTHYLNLTILQLINELGG